MNERFGSFEEEVQRERRHAKELLPLVYGELRKLAAARLALEPSGQTLQPTALVHEAYLRISDSDQGWDSRGHFFAAAAESMRRILVDRARRKLALKHGGDRQRVELHDDAATGKRANEQMLAVHEALDRLEVEDADKATLVKLRYFVGMTLDESATALGISRATAARHWVFAKAWLHNAMKDDAE
ncbi:MAG: ECF-type sigma factor [Rubripirellula sp.]